MSRTSFKWRSLAALFTLGVAVPASAVDLTTPASWPDGSETITFNIEDCLDDLFSGDDITLTWDLEITTPNSARYSVRVGSNCGESLSTLPDECTELQTQTAIPDSDIITWEGSAEELTQTTSAVCSGGEDAVYYLNLVYDNSEELDGTLSTTSFTTNIEIDATRPDTPTDISGQAGETTIEVSWGEVDDADGYAVYYSTTLSNFDVTPEEWTGPTAVTAADTDAVLTGLSVDNTYYIAVVAEDSAENRSLFGETIEVLTVPATDFWEAYQGSDGATETGGCSSTPTRHAPWAAALALLGFIGLRRRQ